MPLSAWFSREFDEHLNLCDTSSSHLWSRRRIDRFGRGHGTWCVGNLKETRQAGGRLIKSETVANMAMFFFLRLPILRVINNNQGKPSISGVGMQRAWSGSMAAVPFSSNSFLMSGVSIQIPASPLVLVLPRDGMTHELVLLSRELSEL